mmetsp:Transcript_41800/g.99528  ORF Transcript_41800/g.99528 Transcript_41800/m.99528 type:complete len:220 (-) Transcript_41800:173-832(-)
MDHCLVGPLLQQGSHRIVPAIEQQQDGRRLALLGLHDAIKEALLFVDPRLKLMRKLSCKIARPSVADRRQHPESETGRQKPLDDSIEELLMERGPSRLVLCKSHRRLQIQGEKVVVDSVDIRKEFLHLLHQLVLVAGRQGFQTDVGHRVGEEEVVLVVLGVLQLLRELQKVLVLRPEEAHGVHVPHLLLGGERFRIQALRQKDLVLKDVTLRVDHADNA